MRNPARKAVYWFLVLLAGAALIRFGALREERIGEDWTAIVPLALGFTLAPFGIVFLIRALFAARGRARLLAGHRVIARWSVYPSEWEQFRALDERRSGADPSFVNDLWIRRSAPAGPVEVVVGETGLLIDDSYHGLRPGGLPELREVRWLDGPPTCLEFALRYPRGRYGGSVPTTLRVPVPAGSRGLAQRVVDHFGPKLVRRPGVALRNPPKTYRVCALLFTAAAAMAAAGYGLARSLPDGSDPMVPVALLIAGIGLGAFSALLAAAVWLVTRP